MGFPFVRTYNGPSLFGFWPTQTPTNRRSRPDTFAGYRWLFAPWLQLIPFGSVATAQGSDDRPPFFYSSFLVSLLSNSPYTFLPPLGRLYLFSPAAFCFFSIQRSWLDVLNNKKRPFSCRRPHDDDCLIIKGLLPALVTYLQFSI